MMAPRAASEAACREMANLVRVRVRVRVRVGARARVRARVRARAKVRVRVRVRVLRDTRAAAGSRRSRRRTGAPA